MAKPSAPTSWVATWMSSVFKHSKTKSTSSSKGIPAANSSTRIHEERFREASEIDQSRVESVNNKKGRSLATFLARLAES